MEGAIRMNDVEFSDTPLATGTLADYCARFPNSPACSQMMPSNPGSGLHHNGGNSGHHNHHDNNAGHHSAHGGNNGHHPLS
jgi:hypothetical protein